MPSEISLTRHARRKQMFSALPPEADVARPVWNVRSVPILLQKSAVTDDDVAR